MLLSETQVKVNVRIYFCFCPLDLFIFCLPSDLLRRSSAVVIEQAHCYMYTESDTVLFAESAPTNTSLFLVINKKFLSMF